MSQKTAARDGFAVSAATASASASDVWADTGRSMPAMSSRTLRLAAIATAAGAFSGLFGVGGGTIIVPLLVLWLGYEQKEATGTSLTAIIVIGALAAAAQALHGNLDFWLGVAIGVPGALGVVAGTALQQRISERVVAGAFVVLLVGSAAVLVF
jgi:uncharacterized membrane protein YfcA